MASEKQSRLGFWQVLGSVFASAVGVQKNVNRERDFQHGNPLHYVAGGLIFTVVFIASLVALVNIVVA